MNTGPAMIAVRLALAAALTTTASCSAGEKIPGPVNDTLYHSCTLIGVTVSPATANIQVGDTLRAKAHYGPTAQCGGVAAPDYRWRSSDTIVATVDTGGLVRAKHFGVASITALLKQDTTEAGAMIVNIAQPVAASR